MQKSTVGQDTRNGTEPREVVVAIGMLHSVPSHPLISRSSATTQAKAAGHDTLSRVWLTGARALSQLVPFQTAELPSLASWQKVEDAQDTELTWVAPGLLDIADHFEPFH